MRTFYIRSNKLLRTFHYCSTDVNWNCLKVTVPHFTVIYGLHVDWLALHLKVGLKVTFLEIIRSYVDKFNVFFLFFFYYADILKVSSIVSINFVFKIV